MRGVKLMNLSLMDNGAAPESINVGRSSLLRERDYRRITSLTGYVYVQVFHLGSEYVFVLSKSYRLVFVSFHCLG